MGGSTEWSEGVLLAKGLGLGCSICMDGMGVLSGWHGMGIGAPWELTRGGMGTWGCPCG